MLLGSADYLSPEQADGRPIDARTDVYSLGILLYECLTGVLPFRGEGFVAVAMKHCSEPMPDPRALAPAVPEWLAACTLRAAAKDPADRFASADADGRGAGGPDDAGHRGHAGPAGRPGRRRTRTRRAAGARPSAAPALVGLRGRARGAAAAAAAGWCSATAGRRRAAARRRASAPAPPSPPCATTTRRATTAESPRTRTSAGYAVDDDPTHRLVHRALPRHAATSAASRPASG